MTKLVLIRNNPKVYLTINHGDFSIVNPRTNLSRTEPRGGMGGGGGRGYIPYMYNGSYMCGQKKTRGNWVYFRNGKPKITTLKSQRV